MSPPELSSSLPFSSHRSEENLPSCKNNQLFWGVSEGRDEESTSKADGTRGDTILKGAPWHNQLLWMPLAFLEVTGTDESQDWLEMSQPTNNYDSCCKRGCLQWGGPPKLAETCFEVPISVATLFPLGDHPPQT